MPTYKLSEADRAPGKDRKSLKATYQKNLHMRKVDAKHPSRQQAWKGYFAEVKDDGPPPWTSIAEAGEAGMHHPSSIYEHFGVSGVSDVEKAHEAVSGGRQAFKGLLVCTLEIPGLRCPSFKDNDTLYVLKYKITPEGHLQPLVCHRHYPNLTKCRLNPSNKAHEPLLILDSAKVDSHHTPVFSAPIPELYICQTAQVIVGTVQGTKWTKVRKYGEDEEGDEDEEEVNNADEDVDMYGGQEDEEDEADEGDQDNTDIPVLKRVDFPPPSDVNKQKTPKVSAAASVKDKPVRAEGSNTTVSVKQNHTKEKGKGKGSVGKAGETAKKTEHGKKSAESVESPGDAGEKTGSRATRAAVRRGDLDLSPKAPIDDIEWMYFRECPPVEVWGKYFDNAPTPQSAATSSPPSNPELMGSRKRGRDVSEEPVAGPSVVRKQK